MVSGQYTNQVQIALTQHSSQQTIIDLEVTNVCNYSLDGQKIVTHGDPPPPEQQCFAHEDRPLGKDGNKSIGKVADMLLYPNPANTIITVVPPRNRRYNIHIFNALGQTYHSKTQLIEDSVSIDVQNFPDGIYYIKMEGATGNFTKKLILKK